MNEKLKNTEIETSTIFSKNLLQNPKSAHFDKKGYHYFKKDIVGNVFCEPHTFKLSVCEALPHYNKKMNKRYRELPFKKMDIPYKIIENSIYDNILFEVIRIADKLNCYGFKYLQHKNTPFVFYCVKDRGSKSYLYRVTLHNILRGELL